MSRHYQDAISESDLVDALDEDVEPSAIQDGTNQPKVCFTCGKVFKGYRSTDSMRFYCRLECYRSGSDKRLEPRFLSKIDKVSSPSGCWIWIGSLDKMGYGKFKICGRRSPSFAHRLSWEMAKGAIGEGLEVCHRCDNPPCVNPDHLFIGTHTDNMRDAEAKGRLVFARHLNKLTDAQKAEIRAAFRRRTSGESRRFAEKYTVSKQTIIRVVYGYPSELHPRPGRLLVRVPHVNVPVSGEVW